MNPQQWSFEGSNITIRDHIAIEAMKVAYPLSVKEYGTEIANKTYAIRAYAMADALIAESNK